MPGEKCKLVSIAKFRVQARVEGLTGGGTIDESTTVMAYYITMDRTTTCTCTMEGNRSTCDGTAGGGSGYGAGTATDPRKVRIREVLDTEGQCPDYCSGEMKDHLTMRKTTPVSEWPPVAIMWHWNKRLTAACMETPSPWGCYFSNSNPPVDLDDILEAFTSYDNMHFSAKCVEMMCELALIFPCGVPPGGDPPIEY